MQVYIDNRQNDLPINVDNIPEIVYTILQLENQNCDEVGIHFVSIEEISELHQQFFNDPTPTDCISCPISRGNEPYHMLGDVFICPKVAMQYAKEHGEDAYREVTLYMIHGLLHLMGYDDIEEKERASMRKAEERHMQQLQQINLELHS